MSHLTLQDATLTIRSYIQDNYLYMRPNTVIGDEDSLLSKGIIDSMAVMELVALLEDEFGVAVEDADITEEHFGSVLAIARFALSRQPAPAESTSPA